MTEFADAASRARIETDTATTLFVEAGAGSGKTHALVDRVTTLVLRDGVPLRSIAAVTFTEKAGAELRDRLRVEFEHAWYGALKAAGDATGATDALAEAAAEALDDLDSASIGTLHSFAQQLLMAHPIEAGLPPLIDVLDEVGSSVAFEERWAELQRQLLDDESIAEPLLLAMAVGVELKHVRSLAKLFGNDWDLIGDRVLVEPPELVAMPDLSGLVAACAAIGAQAVDCRDADDRLLAKVLAIQETGLLLSTASDQESQLALLQSFRGLKFGRLGRKENWTDIAKLRADCATVVDLAISLVDLLLDACLRHLSHWVAVRVLESAELRRAEGRLEFHDLLVLARDLLRRDPAVRDALQERYQRLLLDEFQDTDPIQIELAVRIAGGAAATAADWRDVEVPPGRLFVVGDPKQSIYRFRRANIATYLAAQDNLGETVALTTNFRTVPPILDWLNAVFARLIEPAEGAQPSYQPLDPHRLPFSPSVEPSTSSPVGGDQLELDWDFGNPEPEPLAKVLQFPSPLGHPPAISDEDEPGADGQGAGGPAVVVLGAEPHQDLPRAQASVLREREAADVAGVVRQALREEWQVYDEQAEAWRPAGLGDIAVLVPARTSLPYLEEALDSAGIPYRAEASSLVYQTAEVRDLLACARALADPSDRLSLVTALRSPLFGCGDDDLFTWKRDGGSFTLTAPIRPELVSHPVGEAIEWLRNAHYAARWQTPSEVLGKIVADRRMLEVATTGPRSRDAWRRLRFVVDQARAWSEVEHGGLRSYLAWAAHQGEETSRVAEAVLPETDADAVRVMTIHAAKGLEFPIVVLSGMTAAPNRQRGVQVLWPADGGYAVKLKASVQTEDFDLVQPVDEQMDAYERRRLLYVAATRARDHLVVSLHRSGNRTHSSNAELFAGADGATSANAISFTAEPLTEAVPTPEPVVIPPMPHDTWTIRITAARAASRRKSAQSASGLEGTAPGITPIAVESAASDPATAKGARDLELPPWSKGRYGTAIGRAVHGVLQVIDLATGAGLPEAVASQCIAEAVPDHAEIVEALVRSALTSDPVRRAAVREHWRESYVGAAQPDGTILEGFVDLIYREDDGTLVIIDYKTDAIPAAALDERVAYYAPQLNTYATIIDPTATQLLLFLTPTTAIPRPLDGS